MQTLSSLRRAAATAVISLAALAIGHTDAQARTQEANLIPFVPFGSSTIAETPTGVRGDLLLASDGNFYVVSSTGGKGGGAIARITPDGTLTVLHSFASTNEGLSSYARLIQASDGNLYGTTYLGGEKGGGVVFRLSLAGDYTVLRSFGQDKLDAILPYTGLVQTSDGNLYGTTLRGGVDDKGTVFRITTSGDLSILHSFDGTNGENPEGTLIVGSDGNLYGTTLQGGSGGRGTIYRITTSGTLTSLYSFASLSAFNSAGYATNATGANPRASLLLAADGNYYGTAYQGGATGYGTIFRMTPAGAVTVVHAFAGPSLGGSFPLAGITQDASGNLYGTTERGGYFNRGAAWRVAANGQFSLLHGFTGSPNDGASPYAGLLSVGNTIYGVSFTDQFATAGAIFKLDQGSNGALPVELSASTVEILLGAGFSLAWSSPTATSCTASGSWTDTVGTSGSLAVTPTSAGIYTYVLTCTDGAGVARNAYATVSVKVPPATPVDGGGGGGMLSVSLLLLLGALSFRKNFKEIFPACL